MCVLSHSFMFLQIIHMLFIEILINNLQYCKRMKAQITYMVHIH